MVFRKLNERALNRLAVRNEEERERNLLIKFAKENSGITPDDSPLPSESDDGDILSRFNARRRSSVPQTEELKQKMAQWKRRRLIRYRRIVLRFLLGIFLNHFLYFIVSFKTTWQARQAVVSATFGFFVALAMAFSETVYSIVLLCIPQFSSEQGRAIILLYIVIMIYNGPIMNIGANYEETTRMLACGNEVAFNATRGLRSVLNDGQAAVLKKLDYTIGTIIEAVKLGLSLIKTFLKLRKFLNWRTKLLYKYITDLRKACDNQLINVFCEIPRFVGREAYRLLGNKIDRMVATVKNAFKFSINYTYEFDLDYTTSKSGQDIANEILDDVNQSFTAAQIFYVWVWMVYTFAFILILFQALQYRHYYLYTISFDNVYITKQFIRLDRRYKKKTEDFVLPLYRRELYLYVWPLSWRLSWTEMGNFGKGLFFVSLNILYGLGVMAVDFLFYLFLKVINMLTSRRYASSSWQEEVIERAALSMLGRNETSEEFAAAALYNTNLNVTGDGFVPIIYRTLISTVEELAAAGRYEINLEKCLPVASPPDWDTYAMILFLYTCAYFFVIGQSYILRARRAIMAKLYPDRERARIGFLHVTILKNRRLSLDADLWWLMTKMRGKAKKNDLSLLRRMEERRGPCSWIARIISGRLYYSCVVCSRRGREDEADRFQVCPTPGCTAVYCNQCYDELHGNCIACFEKSPDKKLKVRDEKTGELVESSDSLAERVNLESGIEDSSAEEDGDEVEMELGPPLSARFIKSSSSSSSYLPLSTLSESESDDDEVVFSRSKSLF